MASRVTTAHGFSSMAHSIYDTAWASLITKTTNNQIRWLFPECLEFILRTQLPDGGWTCLSERYPESVFVPDALIHSLAGLWALCRHQRTGVACVNTNLPGDIKERTFSARAFVNGKLQVWDVDQTTHFGFELLVSILLDLLQEEEGISFDFPGKGELRSRFDKASNIDLEWIYTEKCEVPLFSLEGFIGKLDFSRLSHLVSDEGILASPASTAAYMMYAPEWNDTCEDYMRTIIEHNAEGIRGAVPSIFPLTIFESSWVLTTLLDNGFTVETLGSENVDVITSFLKHQLTKNGNVVGATTSFAPDADDTSRALITLSFQNQPSSPASLIEQFESDTYFQTFGGRIPNLVPSISVNSNCLNALVLSPEAGRYLSQIEKCARFICGSWKEGGGLNDHWNISEFYCLVHMTQSLAHLYSVFSQGHLPGISKDLIEGLVPSTMQRALKRILETQNEDGSWGELHNTEETAYAIISLGKILALDFVKYDHPKLEAVIEKGKKFVAGWSIENPSRVWTGKVWHADLYIEEAYVLAALNVNIQR